MSPAPDSGPERTLPEQENRTPPKKEPRALLLLLLALAAVTPAAASMEMAEEITVDTSGLLRMEYRTSPTTPVEICPVGASCTDWIRVPGTDDVWQRGVQDGPDTFPTIRERPQPPKQKPWRDERERAPRRGVREETGTAEVIYLDPPEPDVIVLPFLCTDTDSECKAVLTAACQKAARSNAAVEFAKYTYDRVEKVCAATCPDGTRVKCVLEPVNAQPKPPPRDQALLP